MLKQASIGVAGVVAGAITSAGIIHIYADLGGNVLSYVAHYDDLARRGVKVEIDGDCASSCTMGLAYPNFCVKPNATMRFHPSYTPFYFFYIMNPMGTKIMIDHYPPDARKVIDAHGDLTKDPGGIWSGGWKPKLFTIHGREFPEHYICK